MDSAKTDSRVLQGIGASPGIAIGMARITDRSRVAVVERGITPVEVAAEVARFKRPWKRQRKNCAPSSTRLRNSGALSMST